MKNFEGFDILVNFTSCFSDFNLYADFSCSYAAYSLEVNFHILE